MGLCWNYSHGLGQAQIWGLTGFVLQLSQQNRLTLIVLAVKHC